MKIISLTHVAFLKFVDIGFAQVHQPLPRVAEVPDDGDEDVRIRAAAVDVARADGDAVLYYCGEGGGEHQTASTVYKT